jgi:ketosteroid isomerase-like protein
MRSAALVLLLLASCSKEDTPPPDIGANKQKIWDTIKAYHEAGDKADVETMATYLAPEMTLFKGQEDFVRTRDEAVKEITERVKAFQGQSRNTLLGREVINITGDVGVVTYVASVGTQRAAITAVLRRSQGKWLLSHLHESWPAPTNEKPHK